MKNKQIRFSADKNNKLKKERGVWFEDVLLAIERGDILDDLTHPNTTNYPNQSILVLLLRIKNYVYIVPYSEDDHFIFLKTIIPSRKMNKRYNKDSQL